MIRRNLLIMSGRQVNDWRQNAVRLQLRRQSKAFKPNIKIANKDETSRCSNATWTANETVGFNIWLGHHSEGGGRKEPTT
jgi:hypothetical protein